MTKCDIASLYSFYNLEDIILGNHNRRDEGYAVVQGVMINAAGQRASEVAAIAGFDLPVEPRRPLSCWLYARS